MKKFEVFTCWIGGVCLMFVGTLLPIAVALLVWGFHIESETLSYIIKSWISASLFIAGLSALVIIPSRNDWHVKYFAENGQKMLFYYNFVAWIIWSVRGIRAFDRRCFPPDEGQVNGE